VLGPQEQHVVGRIGWIRAAILGANDGIVSTASLIVGMAAASTTRENVITAGLAGLMAGAMSMAAGEYVSVSSQSDTEKADLARETRELETSPEFEKEELAAIYMQRGLDPGLARQVAEQMMHHDALGSHARDELGISDMLVARPVQAAFTSALTFAAGAALPLIALFTIPSSQPGPAVAVISLFFLASLGALAARVGGAPVFKSTVRVTFWGAVAMTATAAVGGIFGTVAA
jgi:VIT1/CCC1 family predicted Fe2+/Mn2+ transporter